MFPANANPAQKFQKTESVSLRDKHKKRAHMKPFVRKTKKPRRVLIQGNNPAAPVESKKADRSKFVELIKTANGLCQAFLLLLLLLLLLEHAVSASVRAATPAMSALPVWTLTCE